MKNTIDNQKKSENALKLKNQLYADLANALPSGIYRLRVFHGLSFNEEKWMSSSEAPYIVEFANDRFYEIVHLDRNVYENNPGVIHDLIFEEDKSEFARLNVESNLHIVPFLWEGRLLIDHKIKWVRFKSIPRVLENQDIIWTGTLEDITLRKQNEEEIIKKTIELERLNAAKDFFMSLLAHDLKSPFTSILGFLELLTSKLYEYDIAEIEKLLAIVKYSANYTYNLLDDILVWGMSDSGKIQFNPVDLNLKSNCDHVIEILKTNANIKEITIVNEINENEIVFADTNMLNTILRNLVSNAIKYTRSGGKITLHSVTTETESTISISDNGIGIEPEKISTLFDQSQIYSRKGTANELGIGFGLILCKKFVDQHGGTIWAETNEEHGCTFKFTLPKITD